MFGCPSEKALLTTQPHRKHEKMWAIGDGFEVVFCECFECPNSSSEAFYVPRFGFTGTIGDSIFRNKEVALAAAKEKVKKEIITAETRVSFLKMRLESLERE